MNHNLCELSKITASFAYFAENYLEVSAKPFKLFPYQADLIAVLDKHDHVIVPKFRQGGFTSTVLAFLLWKSLLSERKILYCGCSAEQGKSIISRFLNSMHVKGLEIQHLDRGTIIVPDTGSQFDFVSYHDKHAIHNAEDVGYTDVYLDEVAFDQDAGKHWGHLVSDETTTRCYVTSTANGKKNNAAGFLNGFSVIDDTQNWFHAVLTDACEGENKFHVYRTTYLECPLWTPKRIKETKDAIGNDAWAQEMDIIFPELGCNYSYDGTVIQNRQPNNDRVQVVGEVCGYTRPSREFVDRVSSEKRLGELSETVWAGLQEVDDVCWLDDLGQRRPQKAIDRDFEQMEEICNDWKGSQLNSDYDPTLDVLAGVAEKEDIMKKETVPERKRITVHQKCQERVLHRVINRELPKDMQLTIADNAICVNGVPTRISGRSVEYLYKGLAEFEGQRKALKLTTKLVRRELKKLFAVRRRKKL